VNSIEAREKLILGFDVRQRRLILMSSPKINTKKLAFFGQRSSHLNEDGGESLGPPAASFAIGTASK
jgi:hypothetical protein